MLDEATRAHCEYLKNLCADQNLDLFETLEKAGLLLSTDKRLMVQKSTIAMALIHLEDQQHTDLGHLGGAQTVSGAVRGCIKFLENFTRSMR